VGVLVVGSLVDGVVVLLCELEVLGIGVFLASSVRLVLPGEVVPPPPPPQEASIKVASVAQERARRDPRFNTTLDMAIIPLEK
jgi:hypothetical protein